MNKIKTFSISNTRKMFKGPWDPKDLIELDNRVLRVAKFEGKYGDKLHTHDYGEFFLVLEGSIEISLDNDKIMLDTFDGAIIPAGIPHQPNAKEPALVLMLDRKE